jgi:hypothetical protein
VGLAPASHTVVGLSCGLVLSACLINLGGCRVRTRVCRGRAAVMLPGHNGTKL